MRSDKSRFNEICSAKLVTVRTGFKPRWMIQYPPMEATVRNRMPPSNKARNILFNFRSRKLIGTTPRMYPCTPT